MSKVIGGLALFSVLVVILTGCGGNTPPPPTVLVPSIVPQQSIPIHFWVTNQAFAAPVKAVQMTLSLEGQVIFDQNVPVLNQSHVEVVNQNISAGPHTLTVKVGEPFSLSADKVINIGAESWVIAGFWMSPHSTDVNLRTPHVTIELFDQQPGIQ